MNHRPGEGRDPEIYWIPGYPATHNSGVLMNHTIALKSLAGHWPCARDWFLKR